MNFSLFSILVVIIIANEAGSQWLSRPRNVGPLRGHRHNLSKIKGTLPYPRFHPPPPLFSGGNGTELADSSQLGGSGSAIMDGNGKETSADVSSQTTDFPATSPNTTLESTTNYNTIFNDRMLELLKKLGDVDDSKDAEATTVKTTTTTASSELPELSEKVDDLETIPDEKPIVYDGRGPRPRIPINGHNPPPHHHHHLRPSPSRPPAPLWKNLRGIFSRKRPPLPPKPFQPHAIRRFDENLSEDGTREKPDDTKVPSARRPPSQKSEEVKKQKSSSTETSSPTKSRTLLEPEDKFQERSYEENQPPNSPAKTLSTLAKLSPKKAIMVFMRKEGIIETEFAGADPGKVVKKYAGSTKIQFFNGTLPEDNLPAVFLAPEDTQTPYGYGKIPIPKISKQSSPLPKAKPTYYSLEEQLRLLRLHRENLRLQRLHQQLNTGSEFQSPFSIPGQNGYKTISVGPNGDTGDFYDQIRSNLPEDSIVESIEPYDRHQTPGSLYGSHSSESSNTYKVAQNPKASYSPNAIKVIQNPSISTNPYRPPGGPPPQAPTRAQSGTNAFRKPGDPPASQPQEPWVSPSGSPENLPDGVAKSQGFEIELPTGSTNGAIGSMELQKIVGALIGAETKVETSQQAEFPTSTPSNHFTPPPTPTSHYPPPPGRPPGLYSSISDHDTPPPPPEKYNRTPPRGFPNRPPPTRGHPADPSSLRDHYHQSESKNLETSPAPPSRPNPTTSASEQVFFTTPAPHQPQQQNPTSNHIPLHQQQSQFGGPHQSASNQQLSQHPGTYQPPSFPSLSQYPPSPVLQPTPYGPPVPSGPPKGPIDPSFGPPFLPTAPDDDGVSINMNFFYKSDKTKSWPATAAGKIANLFGLRSKTGPLPSNSRPAKPTKPSGYPSKETGSEVGGRPQSVYGPPPANPLPPPQQYALTNNHGNSQESQYKFQADKAPPATSNNFPYASTHEPKSTQPSHPNYHPSSYAQSTPNYHSLSPPQPTSNYHPSFLTQSTPNHHPSSLAQPTPYYNPSHGQRYEPPPSGPSGHSHAPLSVQSGPPYREEFTGPSGSEQYPHVKYSQEKAYPDAIIPTKPAKTSSIEAYSYETSNSRSHEIGVEKAKPISTGSTKLDRPRESDEDTAASNKAHKSSSGSRRKASRNKSKSNHKNSSKAVPATTTESDDYNYKYESYESGNYGEREVPRDRNLGKATPTTIIVQTGKGSGAKSGKNPTIVITGNPGDMSNVNKIINSLNLGNDKVEGPAEGQKYSQYSSHEDDQSSFQVIHAPGILASSTLPLPSDRERVHGTINSKSSLSDFYEQFARLYHQSQNQQHRHQQKQQQQQPQFILQHPQYMVQPQVQPPIIIQPQVAQQAQQIMIQPGGMQQQPQQIIIQPPVSFIQEPQQQIVVPEASKVAAAGHQPEKLKQPAPIVVPNASPDNPLPPVIFVPNPSLSQSPTPTPSPLIYTTVAPTPAPQVMYASPSPAQSHQQLMYAYQGPNANAHQYVFPSPTPPTGQLMYASPTPVPSHPHLNIMYGSTTPAPPPGLQQLFYPSTPSPQFLYASPSPHSHLSHATPTPSPLTNNGQSEQILYSSASASQPSVPQQSASSSGSSAVDEEINRVHQHALSQAFGESLRPLQGALPQHGSGYALRDDATGVTTMHLAGGGENGNPKVEMSMQSFSTVIPVGHGEQDRVLEKVKTEERIEWKQYQAPGELVSKLTPIKVTTQEKRFMYPDGKTEVETSVLGEEVAHELLHQQQQQESAGTQFLQRSGIPKHGSRHSGNDHSQDRPALSHKSESTTSRTESQFADLLKTKAAMEKMEQELHPKNHMLRTQSDFKSSIFGRR